MNDLVLAAKAADWYKLKALVLDSVSSPITRRVYNMALDEFMVWFHRESRPGFSKASRNAALGHEGRRLRRAYLFDQHVSEFRRRAQNASPQVEYRWLQSVQNRYSKLRTYSVPRLSRPLQLLRPPQYNVDLSRHHIVGLLLDH